MRYHLAAAMAVAALTAAPVAYAQTHEGHTTTPAQTPAGKTSTAAPRAQHMAMTDAQFVPMMMQHHKDGIEMSRVAEQKATTSQVKQLAAKIRANQERELQELEHFQQTAGTSGAAGHDGHADAMMQMSKKSIERVQSANGKDVDHAFLEEMSSHHQMAIDMVGMTTFKDARLKQSANKMAAGQRREIQELKSTHKKIG